jgi:acetamidase/formamidase
MKRIPREQAKKFAFNYSDTPLISVNPGEQFEIETWDAGIGFFKSSADKAIPANRPGFDRTPPLVNPIAGPIFIEGLERGDTLVVNIHQIEVEKTSWIAVGPNRGPLGESSRWNEISGEYSTMVFDHSPGPSGTTVDGTLHFNERISWPITFTVDLSILKRESKRFPSLVPKRSNIPDRLHQRSMNVLGRFIAV